jgi:hypothetical protein
VRAQSVCGGHRQPPGSPPLIAGGKGSPRKDVDLGHQDIRTFDAPEEPEQLYGQQDDGCDQEPRGYAQKLEIFFYK